MKRVAFLKWVRSWTKKYGHRWRSVRRDGSRHQAVRCTLCGARVVENGQVISSSPFFGSGPKQGEGSLRDWMEASLPVCKSMEEVVYDVMES